MKKMRFIFLVLIGTFLAGCANFSPHKFDESFMSPNISMSDHAVLRMNPSVRIWTINGRTKSNKTNEYFPEEFYLLPPGVYTFSVSLHLERYNSITTSGIITLSGSFQAGHIYTIKVLDERRSYPFVGGGVVIRAYFAIIDETDPNVWMDDNKLGFKCYVSPYQRQEIVEFVKTQNGIIEQLIENGNTGVPLTMDEKLGRL